MKKFFLFLLPCSLLLILGCSKTCNCKIYKEELDSGTENPEHPGEPGVTNTDLLCNPNGWVMASATVSPAYEMSNGTLITNWMESWMYQWEWDDVIKFMSEGTQIISPGTMLPPDNETEGYVSDQYATWSFNTDETKLNMQIPFFYDYTGRTFDSEVENVHIIELSETVLRITYLFNASTAKEQYSLTLTYTPANDSKASKSDQLVLISEKTMTTTGNCSDLNKQTTTTDANGIQFIEKTECK